MKKAYLINENEKYFFELQLTNKKKMLHIIYARWSLHCSRPLSRCSATFIAGESNDFLPQDVMCNAY